MLFLIASLAFAAGSDTDLPVEAVELVAADTDLEDTDLPKAQALPEIVVPATDAEAVEDLKEAVTAFEKGQWFAFGALLFGLLAFVWNRFRPSKG